MVGRACDRAVAGGHAPSHGTLTGLWILKDWQKRMPQTDANVRIGQPVDPINLRPQALGDVKAIVAVALLLGAIGFALVEFQT